MTGIIEPIIAGIVVSLINRFILNKQNLQPLLQQQALAGESTAINSASASVASNDSSQSNGVVHMSH
jgi:hypothetical protein